MAVPEFTLDPRIDELVAGGAKAILKVDVYGIDSNQIAYQNEGVRVAGGRYAIKSGETLRLPRPATGSTPAMWQYAITAAVQVANNHPTTVGPYYLTPPTSDTTVLLPAYANSVAVGPTFEGGLRTEMVGYRDQARAAAGMAADDAARLAAAAVAADRAAVAADRAAVEQKVISDLGTSDGQMAAVASIPTSEFSGVLNAAIGDYAPERGGATKTDGQNVARFRRPVFTVDKQWPSARHDHQIVWVDETAKIAYAIGQDNALRKSTWNYATDEAQAFGLPTSKAASTHRWCDSGLFLRIPTTGELLWEEVEKSTGLTTLRRSTDDGHTSTVVWTAPSPVVRFLGPQSLVRDEKTGHLYIVEYTSSDAPAVVSIHRSTDRGATWSAWVTMDRHDSNPGTIRHWHSARYDSVSERVYFLAGDGNADAGIYRTNNAGTGVEAVVTNSDLESMLDLPAGARCVDIMFFPTHIVWATDGSGAQDYVLRMARSEIGKVSPNVEKVAAVDSTGWWAQRASSDGSVWVCSTSTEQAGPEPDKGLVHLYAVTENGLHVDEVAAWVMDGDILGHASVSGLGGGSGGGDAFWLRAHGYQTFPYQTQSAFALRARLGAGVVQVQKPPTRSPVYLEQTRDSGAVSLAPSATMTFGFTRALRRAKALYVRDFGAKVLTGEPNFYTNAKLEVWNASTSTKLFEWAGQSWRYDGGTDTDEHYGPFACAEADQIEFRLTNTHTAAITASAYIVFGWGF